MLTTIISSAQYMSFGPKAGINFSTLTNPDNGESLTGLTAGGFYVYSIIENFGVSADLLYSGEGGKFTTEFSDGNIFQKIELRSRLHYIRVPILANIFFGRYGDNFRPKFSVGPSFGFLAGVTNKAISITTEGSTEVRAETKNTSSSGYATMDVGLLIGAGFNYKVADAMWFNMDVRYTFGLTDIYETNLLTINDVKTNAASITVGLAFGIGEVKK